MLQLIYETQPTVKSKKQQNAEPVERVQSEFLHQVGEGKSPKEAFFESLKAIDEPKKEEEDRFETQSTENSVASALKYLTPSNIKPWLELITFTIPIIKQIMELFPKQDNNKPQEV